VKAPPVPVLTVATCCTLDEPTGRDVIETDSLASPVAILPRAPERTPRNDLHRNSLGFFRPCRFEAGIYGIRTSRAERNSESVRIVRVPVPVHIGIRQTS
jgi:hypothetical protein